jgi:predicted dehydrogenase
LDRIAIVGAGFVADLYMRSLETFPDIQLVAAYDHRPERLKAFCDFWKVDPAASLDDLLSNPQFAPTLVLNLTNPGAHFEVSRACLLAGRHVYSEKPLAMTLSDARALHALAGERGLLLASAPCSVLSEAAQTAWRALRKGMIGAPYLVYAELDDDFIPQAPYQSWKSESGAPWPAEDEFRVGCTLEHAGYYLTWLMAMFGPVTSVVAASAGLIPAKLPAPDDSAPDFSTALLKFDSGVIARLTCSIIAPHNHALRIFGDAGVLELEECWSNTAAVRIRKRHTLRRRLINSPIAKRVSPPGRSHPKVGRRGAASMNFMLGPAEMLAALREGRPCRLSADFALHLTEVTLAIQNAGFETGAQAIQSRFKPMAPMEWAQDGEAVQ